MASRQISKLIFQSTRSVQIPAIYTSRQCLGHQAQCPAPRVHPGLVQFYSTKSTPEPKSYTFSTLQPLTLSPTPSRIIIDVREPSELQDTGRIPGAKSMPIVSNPEAIFLPAEEFEEKFGFEKPGLEEAEGEGKEGESAKEVIFYCKAGVRSRAAARMAAEEGGWRGVKLGDFRGGWLEWEQHGGKGER